MNDGTSAGFQNSRTAYVHTTSTRPEFSRMMIPSTDMIRGSNRGQKPHERFVHSGQAIGNLRRTTFETSSGGVRRRVSTKTKYEARITLAVRLHRDVSSVSRRSVIGLSLPPFHMHAAAARHACSEPGSRVLAQSGSPSVSASKTPLDSVLLRLKSPTNSSSKSEI